MISPTSPLRLFSLPHQPGARISAMTATTIQMGRTWAQTGDSL